MRRFFHVATFQRVPVYVHWSALALVVGALVLAPAPPAFTLVAASAYFGLLLLHEWGHVLVARARRCAVWSIEIYPFVGVTRHAQPYYSHDDAVIAWGGVAAQLVVALPLMYSVARVGFRGPGLANTVVAIFGPLSLVIAALNLVPVAPLDGARAWRALPALLQHVAVRWPGRRARRMTTTGWR